MNKVSLYVFILGLVFVISGIVEISMPTRAFDLWKRYVRSKWFFIHGAILMAGGIPLIMYQGSFSTPILIIAMVGIFTGPFILLYPDKVRAMYDSIAEEHGPHGVRNFVYFDAAMRTMIGILFIATQIF